MADDRSQIERQIKEAIAADNPVLIAQWLRNSAGSVDAKIIRVEDAAADPATGQRRLLSPLEYALTLQPQPKEAINALIQAGPKVSNSFTQKFLDKNVPENSHRPTLEGRTQLFNEMLNFCVSYCGYGTFVKQSSFGAPKQPGSIDIRTRKDALRGLYNKLRDDMFQLVAGSNEDKRKMSAVWDVMRDFAEELLSEEEIFGVGHYTEMSEKFLRRLVLLELEAFCRLRNTSAQFREFCVALENKPDGSGSIEVAAVRIDGREGFVHAGHKAIQVFIEDFEQRVWENRIEPLAQDIILQQMQAVKTGERPYAPLSSLLESWKFIVELPVESLQLLGQLDNVWDKLGIKSGGIDYKQLRNLQRLKEVDVDELLQAASEGDIALNSPTYNAMQKLYLQLCVEPQIVTHEITPVIESGGNIPRQESPKDAASHLGIAISDVSFTPAKKRGTIIPAAGTPQSVASGSIQAQSTSLTKRSLQTPKTFHTHTQSNPLPSASSTSDSGHVTTVPPRVHRRVHPPLPPTPTTPLSSKPGWGRGQPRPASIIPGQSSWLGSDHLGGHFGTSRIPPLEDEWERFDDAAFDMPNPSSTRVATRPTTSSVTPPVSTPQNIPNSSSKPAIPAALPHDSSSGSTKLPLHHDNLIRERDLRERVDGSRSPTMPETRTHAHSRGLESKESHPAGRVLETRRSATGKVKLPGTAGALTASDDSSRTSVPMPGDIHSGSKTEPITSPQLEPIGIREISSEGTLPRGKIKGRKKGNPRKGGSGQLAATDKPLTADDFQVICVDTFSKKTPKKKTIYLKKNGEYLARAEGEVGAVIYGKLPDDLYIPVVSRVKTGGKVLGKEQARPILTQVLAAHPNLSATEGVIPAVPLPPPAAPAGDFSGLSSLYFAAEKVKKHLDDVSNGYEHISAPEFREFKKLKKFKEAEFQAIHFGDKTIWQTLNPEGRFQVQSWIEPAAPGQKSELEQAEEKHEAYRLTFATQLDKPGGIYQPPGNKKYFFQRNGGSYELMLKPKQALTADELAEATRELLVITRDMENRIDVSVRIYDDSLKYHSQELAATIVALGATVAQARPAEVAASTAHSVVEQQAKKMSETAIAPEFKKIKEQQRDLWATVRGSGTGIAKGQEHEIQRQVVEKRKERHYRLMSAAGSLEPKETEITGAEERAYWATVAELEQKPAFSCVAAVNTLTTVLQNIENPAEIADGIAAYLVPIEEDQMKKYEEDAKNIREYWQEESKTLKKKKEEWWRSAGNTSSDEDSLANSDISDPEDGSTQRQTWSRFQDSFSYTQREDQNVRHSTSSISHSSADDHRDEFATRSQSPAATVPESRNATSTRSESQASGPQQESLSQRSLNWPSPQDLQSQPDQPPLPQPAQVSLRVQQDQHPSTAAQAPRSRPDPVATSRQSEIDVDAEHRLAQSLGGEEEAIVMVEHRSLYDKQKNIGDRKATGFTFKDVKDDGNCFYRALAEQLGEKIEALAAINFNQRHTYLRRIVEGADAVDERWAGQEQIEKTAREFRHIIAIMDTRYPERGFYCCWHENGLIQWNLGKPGDPQPPIGVRGQPIVRLAYTGNHFMSVEGHDDLSAGALRGKYKWPPRGQPVQQAPVGRETLFGGHTTATGVKANPNLTQGPTIRLTSHPLSINH